MHDLRISVTDRCNFRCTYCMPREVYGRDFVFLPRDELLTFEEIARLARLFATLGVRKVRLTGGEPLLRRDLPVLVRMLKQIPAVDDLTLTTNGSLLARHALALADAGLDRVSVSLDSLDDETFAAMNDVGFPVSAVLEGIEAAAEAGLRPIKVNMVVHTNGWRLDDVVPASEILARIDAEMPLVGLSPNYTGEVANRWAYRDDHGEVGVIASVSQPFCGDCSRARLTADGQMYTCLFASTGHDLRAPLRHGAADDELLAAISAVWHARDDRYSELRSQATRELPILVSDPNRVEMSRIGG
jgi:cyclic pyranopterin phosphate synthase